MAADQTLSAPLLDNVPHTVITVHENPPSQAQPPSDNHHQDWSFDEENLYGFLGAHGFEVPGPTTVDPFKNYTPGIDGLYEWVKIVVCLPIAALRLVLFGLCLAVGYLATVCALRGWEDKQNPMPKWRCRLMWVTRLCSRCILFSFGYHWIRRKGRPAPREIAPIIVSNHVSYIEPIFFFYELFPTIVASEAHDSMPFVGTIIRAMQVIYVNRFSHSSRKHAVNEIKRKASCDQFPRLLLFPEGTTTNGRAIISFQLGAFIPGYPIQPVIVHYPHAKDVGNLIVATRNESITPKGYKDKSGAISFVDRRVALEMAETARESWRRRDITNFEYLMILNTLSGRSYNDLTQYPVFPWVLADYSSESLDFNKSSTFRDLSKPVGALDLKRFEVFEDRYRNFCDPDIPSFYYGSHYSSMGIVLFYLLRLEPFTALHRNLQGGKFDHADRLFQSIEGTYKNCLSNTSDVKELIPEFFYMPEFLGNTNSYHFGVRQDGEPLGDVLLPTWAKGSAEEFISKNREALESEYVSSNLHHWIDLVFGYKQRGKPAVEAANVFYYLTYEGAVDLDTMDDELQRSAIEDQIANFGQTPIQIFRKKHPRRGPPIPITHPLKFAPASINLTSIASSSSNSAAVLYVQVLDSSIVLVNQGLTMSVKIWLTTQLQSGGNFTFSGSQDPFFGVGSDVLSPRKIGSPLAETLELGAQCFSTLQMPSENFLISCGTWENSFQVISLADGRMVQSIRQHKDIVSCIAVTSDGSILVTGSYDTTVMVWEVNRLRATEKRVRNAQAELPRRDSVIAETPFHILCGHDDIITCLFASVELDIVISGSKDGTCVFHTLREGRYVRSLQHPSGCAISKLVVSRHGRIVVYADDDLSLHLYSINGKHISSSESSGRLNCMGLSSCGQFLVCAGDQGQIVVWCMYTLEVVRRYTGIGKVITSLTVTPEECFIAGTKDGSLLVYSIDNPQLRKSNVPRNLKT